MTRDLNMGTLSYGDKARLLLMPGGQARLPVTPRQLWRTQEPLWWNRLLAETSMAHATRAIQPKHYRER